jgi:hypothetical protein
VTAAPVGLRHDGAQSDFLQPLSRRRRGFLANLDARTLLLEPCGYLYYTLVMREGQKHHTTISIRLSRDEDRVLRRVARRRKSTVSDLVRHAVSQLAENEARKPLRPYEQIADLIGSVADLPPDLSERTGERFAEIARENAGRRK